jgi:hypothetical protein
MSESFEPDPNPMAKPRIRISSTLRHSLAIAHELIFCGFLHRFYFAKLGMKRSWEPEEGKERKEISIHEFTREQREVLMDEAREFGREPKTNQGFWGWITKFSYFGLPSLLSFFEVAPQVWQEASNEEDLLAVLRSAFAMNVFKRSRLPSYSSFQDAVQLIQSAKNIMVLTGSSGISSSFGAGVSVSCGIPDFRSKNGIYSRLSEFELSDPQEMVFCQYLIQFDLEYFKFRPETFYSFAKEIYPSNFKPSPSHCFIRMLQDKGKLLRNYTQNIDTLENLVGISTEKLVQCHGRVVW